MPNDNGNNKVAFDRFWLSIGIPVMIWVFSAGIGWNKLSYAEESISKLTTKIENVETGKFDTITKLVTLDSRLQEMNRNLERLTMQLDTIVKVGKPVTP
jgi:hypothetical protein